MAINIYNWKTYLYSAQYKWQKANQYMFKNFDLDLVVLRVCFTLSAYIDISAPSGLCIGWSDIACPLVSILVLDVCINKMN